MTNSNNVGNGVGVSSLLGLLFVGLKLTGSIDWSWWWVTAPFWIPPVFVVACLVVGGILIGLGHVAGRLARNGEDLIKKNNEKGAVK